MARDLFRKEALETLDTPDQLDDLLRITSPRAWVALATLIVLLVLALIWGFLGSIPEESKGSGILMLEGGTFTMEAQVRGLVQDIYVQEGDHVTAGAAIARVTQPEQLLKVIKARDRLSKLKSKQAQLQKYSDSFGSMKSSSISSRQKNLEKSITALGNQMVWLQQRLANEEKVYRDGLITRQKLIDTKVSMDGVREKIRTKKDELKELEVRDLKEREDIRKELIEVDFQIALASVELDNLTEESDLYSFPLSPYDGRVIDVDVDIGTTLDRGTPILTLEVSGDASVLEGIMFFPAAQGEKIRKGMTMLVSPGPIEVDKYGSMIGTVTNVSSFPVTEKYANRILQDRPMVEKILKQGAVVTVRAVLIPDPDTPSGYKWTTSRGPGHHIHPGTVAKSSVVVKRRRPASLVIPLFKKWVLGESQEAEPGKPQTE